MITILILLAVGFTVTVVLSAWLFTALQKANKQIATLRHDTSKRPSNQALLSGLVGPLIRDDDPLGNMLRFMYNHEHDTATVKQGYEACTLLLNTMSNSWRLKPTDRYQSVVQYDPQRHRTSSSAQVTKGQPVIVVEPGWTLVNEPIKYAFVKVQD